MSLGYSIRFELERRVLNARNIFIWDESLNGIMSYKTFSDLESVLFNDLGVQLYNNLNVPVRETLRFKVPDAFLPVKKDI